MTAQVISLADHRRARELRRFQFGAGAIIWPLALVAGVAFCFSIGWGVMQIYSILWG